MTMIYDANKKKFESDFSVLELYNESASSSTMASIRSTNSKTVKECVHEACDKAGRTMEAFMNQEPVEMPQDAENQLMLNQGIITHIKKRLQKKKTTSLKFDGDSFDTHFSMRAGELYAVDPDNKGGRKVVDFSIFLNPDAKPHTLKGLILKEMHKMDPEGEFGCSFHNLCETRGLDKVTRAKATGLLLVLVYFLESQDMILQGNIEQLKLGAKKPITDEQQKWVLQLVKNVIEMVNGPSASENHDANDEAEDPSA